MQIAKAGAILVVALLVGCITTTNPADLERPVTPERVAAYLEEDRKPFGFDEVPRFLKPPKVLVMFETATLDDVRNVRRAVEILNGALPDSFQLSVGKLNINRTAMLNNEIGVIFARRKNWPIEEFKKQYVAAGHSPHLANLPSNVMGIGIAANTEDDSKLGYSHAINAGTVLIDSEGIKRRGGSDEAVVSTLVHELLHVFGRQHPNSSRFPDTIMNPDAPDRLPEQLWPLDVAVLKAVYGSD